MHEQRPPHVSPKSGRTGLQNNALHEEAPSLSSELKHFDEQLQGELSGYQEASPDRRELLDDLARSLEAAKQRFWLLNEEQGHTPADDPELDRLLERVRQDFKNLSTATQNGGPPLA